MRPPVNIVWFKKDLRLHDHQPLKDAIEGNQPLLLIYIFEPSLQAYADWDIRHWQFIYLSLQEMNTKLATFNTKIHLFFAEAEEVFDHLNRNFTIHSVFSFQETGVKVTFDRDILMSAFFLKNNILWKEYRNNGIVRGLKNRKDWDKQWIKAMESPLQNPDLEGLQSIDFEVDISFWADYATQKNLDLYNPLFQPAGEKYAWKYLTSFFKERGKGYTKFISKPTESRYHSSRLSPYITWGNLSSRQVYQYYLSKRGNTVFLRDIDNFRSRLQWRCHFIQKFESECRMEFEHLNKNYTHLQQEINPEYLIAWQEAKTGFPLVDACMMAVRQTGFLNFRMRAMLVSFLTHQLWQPWQAGVHFLAKQFLDYEPGIHFSQFQMQAGVWGVNTIRIYNPVKQSLVQDPEGIFIKKWIPALRHLPKGLIHEPWKMTEIEQDLFQCKLGIDYPRPIIDIKKTSKHASEVLWGMKKEPDTKQENQRILNTHVKPSRK